jgi:hypothetical protein
MKEILLAGVSNNERLIQLITLVQNIFKLAGVGNKRKSELELKVKKRIFIYFDWFKYLE